MLKSVWTFGTATAGAVLFSLVSVGLISAPAAQAKAPGNGVTLQERLEILKRAYPKTVRAIEGNTLVLTTGEKLTIDDGKKKSHQEKLKTPDIEDMLSQVYPVGPCVRGKPARNFDPGRIRNQRFFMAVYGASKRAVYANLDKLDWYGTSIAVTTVGGVDDAIRAVASGLRKLPGRSQVFVRRTAGTFNWRFIAGTKRLSVHSFGAAIDVDVKYADYWRWSGGKPGNVPAYRNKIPADVIAVFERHGFIWGGRWYHYDTMHFEYRPEMIEIGRLAARRGCAQ